MRYLAIFGTCVHEKNVAWLTGLPACLFMAPERHEKGRDQISFTQAFNELNIFPVSSIINISPKS